MEDIMQALLEDIWNHLSDGQQKMLLTLASQVTLRREASDESPITQTKMLGFGIEYDLQNLAEKNLVIRNGPTVSFFHESIYEFVCTKFP